MSHKPAIIIVAYNRANSLNRLLSSVANAIYNDHGVDLIISIDHGDDPAVVQLSESFEWKHGQKRIIKHPVHLGLKQHILSCGDLSLEYGSVIILEDDLAVSPYFYDYATQAANYYSTNANIAGISLYNYQVAESNFYSFKPIDDGADVYFMQVASSWGQLWTKEQWQKFRDWFSDHTSLAQDDTVPEYTQQWGAHSWKKHFIHYLIHTGTYFVFPRLSLSTNFEEEGTNSSTKKIFHVPLQVAGKAYRFCDLERSNSVYDAWFEIEAFCLNRRNELLSQYEYDVDLYGTKKIAKNNKPYVLTSKAGQKPVVSFSNALFPLESNILLQVAGKEIGLYEKKGNHFEETILPVRNHFETIRQKRNSGISVIIPMLTANIQLIRQTLDSLSLQACENFEVLIPCNAQNLSPVKTILADYVLNSRCIEAEGYATLENLIREGFKKAHNQIVTWIRPGAEWTDHALNDVINIFKLHVSVTMIKGINHLFETDHTAQEKEVMEHRLTKGVIFQNIRSGKLNYTTEGYFLRKHCVEAFFEKPVSLLDLYFHLHDQFQLTVVVKPLIKLAKNDLSTTLVSEGSKKLVLQYARFEEKTRWQAKLIDRIQKLPLVGHESKKWYYTVLQNFPPVLRYDATNGTFYFNKL